MTNKLEAARARLRERVKSKRPQRSDLTPEPRYDEVFFKGLEWLDTLAGSGLPEEVTIIGEKHMDIKELSKQCYHIALAKGWWPVDAIDKALEKNCEFVLARLALIHSEVSEALENARDGEWNLEFKEDGKPVGFPTELADIVIRVCDLAHGMGIDLATAIQQKCEFNQTRPHRHGNKAL